jgi:hypothetical protein
MTRLLDDTMRGSAAVGNAGRPGARSRRRLIDNCFLVLVVLASISPYVGRLGFYSDDWAFVGAMSTAPDQSLAGLWRLQYGWIGLASRPTQIVYQALLYWLFGRDPLGYHVVTGVLLAIMAVLLYWVLVELRLSRTLAVSIAAVYGLLPNYSTNRFWFASGGYVLTMAFYLLSLYADLRALRGPSPGLVRWKLLSLSALVVGALGYEVVIPLFFFNVALVWWFARRTDRGGMRARLGPRGAALFIATPLLLLAAVMAYKAPLAQGAQFPTLYHLAWMANGSVKINFGTYGVGLPYAAWLSARIGGWLVVAGGLVVGFATFVYLKHLFGAEEAPLPSRERLVRLGSIGLVVFTLGYAVFTITNRIAFTSSGNANRLNMAAALGVAVLFVAALGLLARTASARRLRSLLFSLLVASLCAMGFVVNDALAEDWSTAWARQRAAIAGIRTALPELPSRTTVLLHGVCPYVGPGVVFETRWDVQGLLRILYEDDTLRGDVTSQQLAIRRRGLVTRAYDAKFYPYASDLLLVDAARGVVKPLTSARVADEYLRAHPASASHCPTGLPGYGTLVFPMDHFRLPFVARVIELVT